jgi:hypothetical protein
MYLYRRIQSPDSAIVKPEALLDIGGTRIPCAQRFVRAWELVNSGFDKLRESVETSLHDSMGGTASNDSDTTEQNRIRRSSRSKRFRET